MTPPFLSIMSICTRSLNCSDSTLELFRKSFPFFLSPFSLSQFRPLSVLLALSYSQDPIGLQNTSKSVKPLSYYLSLDSFEFQTHIVNILDVLFFLSLIVHTPSRIHLCRFFFFSLCILNSHHFFGRRRWLPLLFLKIVTSSLLQLYFHVLFITFTLYTCFDIYSETDMVAHQEFLWM